MQTEQPYWLNEAYAQSINLEDTGIMVRNQMCAERFAPVLFSLFGPSGRFVDFAGGYGLFTRMMRDCGFDFYWHDAYTENLVARGFEYRAADTVDAVTSFESFEHFVDPLHELRKLLALGGAVFFSTDLAPSPTPRPDQWWYYGQSHGQHIAFYRVETLRRLASMTESMCVTNGSNFHGIIHSPRLPYAIPDRFYKRLRNEMGADVDGLYVRVNARGKSRGWSSLRDSLRPSKRGRNFYLLKDAASAHGALARRLRASEVFAAYTQHLLTDSLAYWQPLLKARMAGRTLSDMELMAARHAPPG